MKVLHICETIKGGVGTYLNCFDRALGEDLDSAYVVPAQHADHLSVAGQVTTFDRPKRGFAALRNLIMVARRTALADKPDILFFQSTYSLLVMAAFRALRVPGIYVYNPHGWARLRYDHRPALQKAVSLFEARLSRLADLVINVSDNDRDVAAANGYGGTHTVVENAMPDLAVSGGMFDHSGINLLFVGRFDRQKGLDLLLEAYRHAAPRNLDLHLHIIGAGVEDGDTQIGDDLPDSLTFHGWVNPSDIARYYASADLVVMPSRWESLPMVIIESLRAATPVMLSEMCGMQTLIEEGRSGFAVPLQAEAWADRLAGLDKMALTIMRPTARALYETRYNEARFRDRMTQVIRTLADRNKAPD